MFTSCGYYSRVVFISFRASDCASYYSRASNLLLLLYLLVVVDNGYVFDTCVLCSKFFGSTCKTKQGVSVYFIRWPSLISLHRPSTSGDYSRVASIRMNTVHVPANKFNFHLCFTVGTAPFLCLKMGPQPLIFSDSVLL